MYDKAAGFSHIEKNHGTSGKERNVTSNSQMLHSRSYYKDASALTYGVCPLLPLLNSDDLGASSSHNSCFHFTKCVSLTRLIEKRFYPLSFYPSKQLPIPSSVSLLQFLQLNSFYVCSKFFLGSFFSTQDVKIPIGSHSDKGRV